MRDSHARLTATLFGLAAILGAACNDSTGPDTGSIEVNIVTTGADIDPDGYTLSMDGAQVGAVTGSSGVGGITISDVSPGDHVIQVGGLATNCTVAGANPLTVAVVAGRATIVPFTIQCVRRSGSVRVTTATTGPELDPDGYMVSVGGGQPLPISANGTVTFTDLQEGSHSIALSDIAGNCSVSGTNPRTVAVTFGGTAEVTFSIQCEATGSLQVTTATTGVEVDPNGYSVRLEGPRLDRTFGVLANETITISTLPAGEYRVTLSGVAANCDVVAPNPRMITVASGSMATTAFDVVCGPITKLAFVSTGTGDAEVYVINSNSTGAINLTNNGASDTDPAWSRDGSKIAFASNRNGNNDIYVMNGDGSNVVQLTTGETADYQPVWSPDGAKIAFVSERDGNAEIYVMDADGTNPVRLTTHTAYDAEPAWSPDGSKIAFRTDRHGNAEIYVMNADGSAQSPLTSDPDQDAHPAWSPDGAKIAFSRGTCGYYGCDQDIYIMNADGSNVTRLLTGVDGDTEPTWSPDGGKIAYTALRCEYYCYYYTSSIRIIRVDGTDVPVQLTNGSAFQPAWRW